MSGVLRLAAYRRLLIAYTLNELTWSIGTLALAILVYRRTGSAVGAMAFFLCSQFVPALLAPALVARLDGRSPRPVLTGLYCSEMILFAALAWVASHFALAAALILVVVDGLMAMTARAIARAATVQVTQPAGLLREGNALANASFSVCFMLGPAIGAAIVSLASTAAALLANAGLFAAITCVIGTTAGLPAQQFASERRRARLRTALAYVKGNRAVTSLFLLQAAGLLFFTIATPVEIVLVQHSFHAGARAYGALLSAWGAGTVVGSILYARWRALTPATLVAGASAAMGVGFSVMAASPSVVVAAAGAMLGGIGNGVVAVAPRTALQEEVEPSWMALVMSLNESIWQVVPGLGIALGGAIAALAGPRPALVVAGAGSLAVAAAAAFLLAPSAAPMMRQAAHQSAAEGDAAQSQ